MNASNITVQNLTWEYCKYWKPETDLQKHAKEVAVMILCVIGILNNIFVIVLAVKYTARKNLHHLIINMAVSDGLYLVLKLWYEFSGKYGIESLYPSGVLGDMLCKTTFFLSETSYKVSLVTLLVISFERFKATRGTLQRSRPYRLRQRVAVVSGCWVLPMILSSYPCYSFHFDSILKLCSSNISWKMFNSYSAVVFLANTVALIIILALSIISIRRLSKSQAIEAHFNKEQLRIRSRRKKSAVSMVIGSALLYACCWFPMYLVLGVILFHDEISGCFDWDSFLYIINNILPCLNACLSPFMYIMLLPDFREATKRVLCCGKLPADPQASRDGTAFSAQNMATLASLETKDTTNLDNT